MRYVERPKVVDAYQLTTLSPNVAVLPDWIYDWYLERKLIFENRMCFTKSLWVHYDLGDWLVKEVTGDMWIVNDRRFHQLYAPESAG
jgi:hypothetical protein